MQRFKYFSEPIPVRIDEMSNPIFIGDNEVEKLDKLIINPRKTSHKDIIDMLINIHNKYKGKYDKALAKFKSGISSEIRKFKEVKFLSQTKTVKSVINKSVTRKRGYSEINDFVRGAILFKTKADCDKFVKKYVRRNKSIVVGYEEKFKGKDKEYGYYGSHHIDLNIDGIIVELQIMTKKLWNYKTAAHEIYNANRSKSDGPDKFDRHNSKKIFALGNMSEDVDLSNLEFTIEELEEMSYDEWKEVDFF